MPLISIIIPAHNEEKYLSHTLQSIQQQTLQDYEVIVVANGCTDKTEEIVKKNNDKRIKLFSLKQANVSRARNHGASKAEGNILFFLDADTTLEATALQIIQEKFSEQYAIATTRVKPDSDEMKYKVAMVFKNFYLKTGLYQGCSGALICRRNDFDNVNGYDSTITVKEHRKLWKKLKPLGKYTCLDTSVTTSMRRLQQWGLWKATTFWAQQWLKDKTGDLKESSYEKIR